MLIIKQHDAKERAYVVPINDTKPRRQRKPNNQQPKAIAVKRTRHDVTDDETEIQGEHINKRLKEAQKNEETVKVNNATRFREMNQEQDMEGLRAKQFEEKIMLLNELENELKSKMSAFEKQQTLFSGEQSNEIKNPKPIAREHAEDAHAKVSLHVERAPPPPRNTHHSNDMSNPRYEPREPQQQYSHPRANYSNHASPQYRHSSDPRYEPREPQQQYSHPRANYSNHASPQYRHSSDPRYEPREPQQQYSQYSISHTAQNLPDGEIPQHPRGHPTPRYQSQATFSAPHQQQFNSSADTLLLQMEAMEDRVLRDRDNYELQRKYGRLRDMMIFHK